MDLQLTDDDLATIVRALEDAAFFRESRALAMVRVAAKGRRGTSEAPVGEADRAKSRDYLALAVRLRKKR